jgi:hypothetical protein
MSSCPACDSDKLVKAADYRGVHKLFQELRRERCVECGLQFAMPMPSVSELSSFNASYFDNAHGGQAVHPCAQAFFSGLAALRCEYVLRYLKKQSVKVRSVMEIGPGPGFFARCWMERNPHTAYFAIETDVSCHKTLRQSGVRLVNVDHGEAPPACDLLVLSHVLEHVDSPTKFLDLALSYLAPGGAIFIEVPCNDWEHKSLDEPHLLFFDKEPMRRLLVRLGLTNVEMSYFGKTIRDLKKTGSFSRLWQRGRSKLIRMGCSAPFGQMRSGMEPLRSQLERAVLAPFLAHRETADPAWWLRAVALKPESVHR